MALINCEECGKEVSSKALACPHCGFKLGVESPKQVDDTNSKTEGQLLWDTVATAGKIAMVACLIIGGCIYFGSGDNRTALEKAQAEKANKCMSAKKMGNANYIQYYCN